MPIWLIFLLNVNSFVLSSFYIVSFSQETKISLYKQRFSVQLEQGTVTSLLEENGTIKGVLYKNKSGEELKAFAPLTIVCDGCFSNLRKSLCSPKVKIVLWKFTASHMILAF